MVESSSAPAIVGEAVEAFARDGFVVVPDLLTDAELDEWGPAVDAAVRARKAHDVRPLADKSRYEQSFLQCVNIWEDFPDVRPLTFHARVAEAAAALLGVPAVRLWHDQALYKEAGGRETDAHQDQPYWPIAEPATITAWIPLDGSTIANGCMAYVPGSHRAGIQRYIDIFSGEPEDLLDDPGIKDVAPVYREVPRGAVAFHHGLTAHLAGANRTSSTRRVHTMIFFADGCTRSTAVRHFAVDRPGIRVGEVIASDLTPIVWPRAAHDVPPAPSFPH